jgi:hypothetical protein
MLPPCDRALVLFPYGRDNDALHWRSIVRQLRDAAQHFSLIGAILLAEPARQLFNDATVASRKLWIAFRRGVGTLQSSVVPGGDYAGVALDVLEESE